MGVIYATADIHSPRFLPLFRESLARLERGPCLLILAGDIIDRGRVEMIEPVVRELEARVGGTPVVAVFGNEEYDEVRGRLVEATRGVIEWIDDSVYYIECPERVAIVGTTGALDRPTRWQRRHRPHLARVYAERPRRVEALIRDARVSAERVVLVSHYGLARATLRGENPRIWPELYSSSMEEVVKRARPDAAVHGHAHRGTPRAIVGGVPIYNVALPLNRALVEVKLRVGLEAFF